MSSTYAARLRGHLNGQRVSITGDGLLDYDLGVVSGVYALQDIPHTIHPLIFNSVLVTGYPSVCAVKKTMNPFHPGSYTYAREIDFATHGHISYVARCIELTDVFGNSHLDSSFDIEGCLSVPDLADCSPVEERWIPCGGKCILGNFQIHWNSIDGGVVSGIAVTHYVIPENNLLPLDVRRRWITLRSETEGHILKIHQKSVLCSDR